MHAVHNGSKGMFGPWAVITILHDGGKCCHQGTDDEGVEGEMCWLNLGSHARPSFAEIPELGEICVDIL